ncbi:hypothetical protein C8J27_10578 [Rhodobacter aestuarii]|uniref:Phytase-like domain-containing protein n=1 Tax=Rhodobacter aestuarii TaxID=453582 RepID=A0A1N7LNY7_9RHOB|nr:MULTISPECIES: esterase-like activity of phytase family protein [Rhodobacter]PTV95135.1 hypothetical protein C8J27_10578 [Rhodobacter aestuarii]SIS75431.1 hypothetical protein SAMN05421580_104198 [Rhodobacter aestuarii]SOC07478.1 hypothetical protein SAMN05877809_10478 [Rhodobacter sp. JA431]
MPHRSCRALIAAFALALGACAATAQDKASFLQSYEWTRPEKAFGGFSALELAEDGRGFIALSDRATLWRGQLARDASGQIVGVQTAGPVVLHDSLGRALRDHTGDSEGLAVTKGGVLYISFEGLARVSVFPTDAGPAGLLPRPEAFRFFPRNGALEALAVAADGTLYTLPEEVPGSVGVTPIWRYRSGLWSQPFAISRDGDWKPVGADFGPDGRFYLLERDFRGLFGFASRVRVFDITGDKISAGEVLLQSAAGQFDNLEGLAVWRDAKGAIRLTMISDDNFLPIQRTEIVEYSVNR